MSSAHETVNTHGRTRLSFAKTADIDEFVVMLEKYERGEITPDQWRSFRLLRGTYGQRQSYDASMLRVKIPQGIITSDQLGAVAEVADRYSRRFGHITTRQNIQLHFVKIHDIEPAMRLLADSGLTTREACGNSVRNITACPYAGTSADELFDVTPYAEATTRFLLRHRLSSSLPRKFKIAFEGCREDHVAIAINDLAFKAAFGPNGERGFLVLAGGGTALMCKSAGTLHEFMPAEGIHRVCEALLIVFKEHGDYEHRQRNRLKFTIKSLGWDGFKARYDEALAEFIREGGASLPFDADSIPLSEQAPDWVPADPPTLQAVAAAASTPVNGPGILPGSVRLKALPDSYVRWMRSNVSKQKQAGYCHVTVRLPLGDFTAGQMRVLADLAEAYGDGSMRLTVDQNVLYRWVKASSVEPFYQRLAAADLAAPDAGTLSDVVSCPGAESCRLAVTQSRGLGRVLTEFLSTRSDLVDLVPSGHIKISGCPNGCGQHHIGSIGFQGSVRKVGSRAVPQYFVLVGGGASDEGVAHFGKVVSKVPVHRLTDAIDRLIGLYKEKREGEEELGAFFRRIPPAMATDALKDLALLLPNETTDQDFVDLGETHVFAPEVMDGECSA